VAVRRRKQFEKVMTDLILQLDDVDLHYQRSQVVTRANLAIRRGQWIALVGPNASGKTTLLRCAAGRLPPSRGVVRLEGRPLYPVAGWQGNLPGYAAAPEELPPFLTVQQSLEIYAAARKLADVPEHSWALCRQLGLAPYARTLIRELSLGTRQKLAVVLALLDSPALLLIDEVFNGLDIRSSLALRSHLRQRVKDDGLTVLMATHSLDIVKSCCDGLVLVDCGKLLHSWEPAELSRYSGAEDLERALAQFLPPAGSDHEST
jgi:ABC-2 type transport system ATP-binding protein